MYTMTASFQLKSSNFLDKKFLDKKFLDKKFSVFLCLETSSGGTWNEFWQHISPLIRMQICVKIRVVN